MRFDKNRKQIKPKSKVDYLFDKRWIFFLSGNEKPRNLKKGSKLSLTLQFQELGNS